MNNVQLERSSIFVLNFTNNGYSTNLKKVTILNMKCNIIANLNLSADFFFNFDCPNPKCNFSLEFDLVHSCTKKSIVIFCNFSLQKFNKVK